MSIPVNTDEYQKYLPIDSGELRRQQVPEHVIARVERLRELTAYWRSYPQTKPSEMVERCRQMFHLSKTQAFDDIHLLKVLIGNLEATTKEYARWRVNQMIEEDRKKAREEGDWRAVASMQKNYILANQLDKEDTPDMAYDKIVPLQIEPTDDPSVLGIKVPKNFRALRDKLIKRYSRDEEYTEYVEVNRTEDAGNG